MRDPKLSHVVGEAVFTSYDGLRVEANGVLGFLTFDCSLLEMRHDPILSALSKKSAVFLQSIEVQSKKYWLIGQVRKIFDLHRRPGIIGACISVSEADRKLAVNLPSRDHVFKVLFPRVEAAMSGPWAGRPLPERLNLLTDVPRREPQVEYRFKADTKFLQYDEVYQVDPEDALDAGFDFIDVEESIGRVLMLFDATKGAMPVDKRFVADVRDAKAGQVRIWRAVQRTNSRERQTRGVQTESQDRPSNFDDICRRLEEIEMRLSLVEADQGIKLVNRVFTFQGAKLKSLNMVTKIFGAGLAIAFIVIMASWYFLSGSSKETNKEPLNSDVETPIENEDSDRQEVLVPSPQEKSDLAIDCSNLQELKIPERADCKEREKQQ